MKLCVLCLSGENCECEMNMHVVVSQDQQLAKPAGAVKLTVLEVFEKDIFQFDSLLMLYDRRTGHSAIRYY